jgi:hypothetical protein
MPNRRELGYVSAGSTSTVYVNGTATGYGVATGGTSSSITVSGQNYTLLSFTSDSNLVVSTAGLFDVLLIGGGGAGGSSNNYQAGGGGGGQVVGLTTLTTLYLPASTIAVDVGAGGVGQTSPVDGKYGMIGKQSGIGSYIYAVGGGGGGQYQPGGNQINSFAAGNGGGAGQNGFPAPSLVGGYSGGEEDSNVNYGGGGGGAGGTGGNASGSVGGTGGSGVDISAWIGQSANTTRVAGGGGGSNNGTGTDGGANGAATNAATPTANKGGGGGGVRGATYTTVGGSGAVYVRFKV